jgi:hypothetical protein
MEIGCEVVISYTISKDVAHGNEASRFGQPPQPRSIHAGSGSWLSGVLGLSGVADCAQACPCPAPATRSRARTSSRIRWARVQALVIEGSARSGYEVKE